MTAPVTFAAPINFQLPLVPPYLGKVDPDLASYLRQLHTSLLLTQQLLAATTGLLAVTFSETVTFGALIQLFSNAGVINARNANSGTGGTSGAVQPCHGFCASPAGVASGKTGFVQRNQGLLQGLSGLTVGADYWLKATNGQVQTTADTAAGHIEQHIGVALDAATISFNTTSWIQH